MVQEITVEIDQVYKVQWGNKSQTDEAVIIAAGTELNMKRQMAEEQATLRSSSSRSTSKPVASSERKRKANDSKTKSGKPAAKVLKVSSPPRLYPVPTVEQLENVITVATTASPSSAATVTTTALPGTTTTELIPDTETAMETQPLLFTETETQLPFTATAVTSTVTTTTTTPAAAPNTPLTSKRDFIFRAARPMSPISGPMVTYIQAMGAAITHQAKETEKMQRLMEASARREVEMQGQMRDIKALLETMASQQATVTVQQPVVNTEEVTGSVHEGLPSHFLIEDSDLKRIHGEPGNAGNFASKLVVKLFPELFGVANLSCNFNWYGGGQLQKTELCPAPKQVIKRYVSYYHPEVASEDSWKERVVPKINEMLRNRQDS